MKATLQSAVLGIVMASAVLPVAGGPVYKWVDESGVVNYSADPPARLGIKTSILDSANSRLSSYAPEPAGLDADSQMRRNTQYLRNRAEQLQRQLDGLDFVRQSAAEQATRRRLEQCQSQRRVDCDDGYEDFGYPDYPRMALVSRRPLLSAPFMVRAAPARAMPPSRPGVRHPGGIRRQP